MNTETQLSKSSMLCSDESPLTKSRQRITIGIALTGVGLVFLFERLGYIESQAMAHYWPLVFALFGFEKIVYSESNYRKLNGLFEIAASFWVFACLEHLWGWTFQVSWPIILIIFGLCKISSALIKDSDTKGSAS